MSELLQAESITEQASPTIAEQILQLEGDELLRVLEALLFVACEPMTEKALANLLEVKESAVKQAVRVLEQQYQERGFVLRQIAGGWQFFTPEQYAHLVEKLYRPKYQQLSAAAMEALAIIAYKQPITRAEISAIRQLDSDSVVTKLLEKKLICEVGRVSGAGHAILYGTSTDFLSFFGINSLEDLPPLPEHKNEAGEAENEQFVF